MRMDIRAASLAALAWASISAPAFAAEQGSSEPAAASASADSSEIIVTARRRNETALETPVVLAAYSGEQLQRLAVTNMTDVAKLTPMLVISPATGPYGGNLTLRGVSSPSGNSSSEPAVTVNVDGVPLSYGGVVRLANIDIGQVEVLKGPQALFFGKNSTGGIVAIHSAEPTSTFKSQFSAGYEFNARQVDLDGYVSGPVSDSLDLRVAGRFSRQRGYFTNVAPTRTFDFAPGTKEEGIRLAANWHPDDRLMVKLRATYHHVKENGSYSNSQKIACPTGVSAGGGAVAGTDDCIANNTIVFAPVPMAALQASTGNLEWDSDTNYLKVKQHLISADVSYQLTDAITLNSITGFYGIRQKQVDASTVGAKYFIGTEGRFKKDAFSEEVRLTFKSPDSPIDLMLGGFYQSDKLVLQDQGAAGTTPLSPFWTWPLRSKAFSAFGQVGWDITKQLNLSAGVRYSRDRKWQYIIPPAPIVNKFTTKSVEFSNWSPEATLSFKPNEDTNLFVSFKEGYKGGAYQIGYNVYGTAASGVLKTGNGINDVPAYYKPETVQGFEGGLKVRLFDRQLRLNLAAYSYLYSNLQLSKFDPNTNAILVVNTSTARVKGLEGDFSFSPQAAPGLTLTGSAAVNSAKYASSFLAACYNGMTSAQGCAFNAAAGGNVRDFNGLTLPRAPKFSGSVGMSYELPVGDSHKVNLNLNGVYTDGYYLASELSPVGRAPSRFIVDGAISFGSESGSYEFSLIGRNLTNRYYAFSGFQTPGTGSGTATATGVLSDYEGPISRGREIWVKVTLRPNAF